MKITVAAGKGGVGKSLVSAYLFTLFSKERRVIALDCDADNPSLHVWLGIKNWEREIPLYLSKKAFAREKINVDCPFGAIRDGRVIGALCHGCELCKIVEGDKVEMKTVLTGWIRMKGNVLSAKLKPGETGSGKIVNEMKKIAENYKAEIEIRDAPAGLGCATTAALQGSDFVIIVTEPTLASLQGVAGIKKLARHFGIDYGVVINKFDLNPKISARIENREEVLGRIPYRKEVFEALVNERLPKGIEREMREIKDNLEEILW